MKNNLGLVSIGINNDFTVKFGSDKNLESNKYVYIDMKKQKVKSAQIQSRKMKTYA